MKQREIGRRELSLAAVGAWLGLVAGPRKGLAAAPAAQEAGSVAPQSASLRGGSGSIGLAPSARSVFAKHSIDNAFLESLQQFDVPFNPGAKLRAYTAINQPNCQVIIEDFMPGAEFTWVFPHDEFQFCLSGEMDLQVWLPPLYEQPMKTRMKAGDVYTYPVGARKHVKVIGSEPYRHICFCPPSPNYPFPRYVERKR
jgi:quercetin dioxygenase-like cupin family protein